MAPEMTDTQQTRARVWDIVRQRASSAGAIPAGADSMALGAEGLGLDSIAIAEVLLDLEEVFDVEVRGLMSGEALTFGRLTELVIDARTR